MNETLVTLRGRVVTEVRAKQVRNGSQVISFRVLTTERRMEEGRWVDGESSFFQVSCWGALGDNVAASVQRGHPIVVTGRLKVREFERDGHLMRQAEINANSIGHDLTMGTAVFRGRRQATRTPEEESAAELAEEMADERWVAGGVGPDAGDEGEPGLAEVVEMSGSGAA